MRYGRIEKAKFIDRPNRFIAHVEVEGQVETVHVKNTGRCKELLLPESTVILEISDNPNRKTRYDIIAVYKDGLGLVNIDSQVPNTVMKEYLMGREDIAVVRPETTYGNSRFDFYFEMKDGRKCFGEVKGCTLEMEGVGYFPDAPTDRGAKHLRELVKAYEEGYETYIFFVIPMEGIKQVLPFEDRDPNFAKAYEEAIQAGVKVRFCPCKVGEDSLEICDCIEGP